MIYWLEEGGRRLTMTLLVLGLILEALPPRLQIALTRG